MYAFTKDGRKEGINMLQYILKRKKRPLRKKKTELDSKTIEKKE